ncbi:hypothetical protein Syun_022134 [Stephania yunnanensis]|uniref:Uncharacterized protein n=1 Tax=Stephania yunnanensis TaxID=152371 RepID=A0AAP0IIV2_9MAGN
MPSTLSLNTLNRSIASLTLANDPHSSLIRSLASLTLAQCDLRENPSFSLFDAFAAHVRSNEPPIVRRPAIFGGGLVKRTPNRLVLKCGARLYLSLRVSGARGVSHLWPSPSRERARETPVEAWGLIEFSYDSYGLRTRVEAVLLVWSSALLCELTAADLSGLRHLHEQARESGQLLVLSRLEGNCLVPSTVSSTGLIHCCDNAEVKDFLASASNNMDLIHLHFSGFCEMCGYRFVVLLIGCRTL